MSYPTLSRAAEGFLLYLGASGRSSHTLLDYKIHLTRFAHWANDTPVDLVTPRHIEGFLLYLRDEFRITRVATTQITHRKLSMKTIKNAHGALSSFWKWVSREFGLVNPFHIPGIRAHTKPIHPLKA